MARPWSPSSAFLSGQVHPAGQERVWGHWCTHCGALQVREMGLVRSCTVTSERWVHALGWGIEFCAQLQHFWVGQCEANDCGTWMNVRSIFMPIHLSLVLVWVAVALSSLLMQWWRDWRRRRTLAYLNLSVKWGQGGWKWCRRWWVEQLPWMNYLQVTLVFQEWCIAVHFEYY